MRFQFLLLYFLVFQLGFSQETERYNFFADQLIPIKTKAFTTKFKNGKVKRKGFVTTYLIDSLEYEVYSGRLVKYNKNGDLSYDLLLDKTGMVLKSKDYISGNLFSKTKTIELDTNATTLEEFFFGKHVSVIYKEEIYKTNKKEKLILFAKGTLINKKRTGKWFFYKDNKSVKIKTYKKRDKFKNMPGITYLRLKID